MDFRCKLIPTTETDVNFFRSEHLNPDITKVTLCSVELIDVKENISMEFLVPPKFMSSWHTFIVALLKVYLETIHFLYK